MLHEVRKSLATKSLDELADWMAEQESSHPKVAEAEFMRRQTLLQAESTQAEKDTAQFTRRSARYMLASVIVLAISAVISASITALQWQEAHHQLAFSMRPSVDFDTEVDTDSPPLGIAIENSGPGPAVIESITYYVDRKPVKDSSEATQYGKLDDKQTIYFDL